jgi:hypothetical protein
MVWRIRSTLMMSMPSSVVPIGTVPGGSATSASTSGPGTMAIPP